MQWFFSSDRPDAVCARHALTGLIVGIAVSLYLSLMRRPGPLSDDAHAMSMSLGWFQGAVIPSCAVIGSLVGLFFVVVRKFGG